MEPSAGETTRKAMGVGEDSHVTHPSTLRSMRDVKFAPSHSDVTVASPRTVMTHIYVLYALVGALSSALAATIWLTSCRLDAMHSALVSSKVTGGKFPTPSGCHDDLSQRLKELLTPQIQAASDASADAQGENLSDLLQKLEVIRQSLKGEGRLPGDELDTRESRTKREVSPQGSVLGEQEDWVWMSSFSRIPKAALQGYCRDAQLYCAAEGKQGPVGPAGQKGEKGDMGHCPTLCVDTRQPASTTAPTTLGARRLSSTSPALLASAATSLLAPVTGLLLTRVLYC